MGSIMTIEEVARKLRISKSTVYKYAEAGRIPSFKIGSCRRFFEGEMDRYLELLTKEHREGAGDCGLSRAEESNPLPVGL